MPKPDTFIILGHRTSTGRWQAMFMSPGLPGTTWCGDHDAAAAVEFAMSVNGFKQATLLSGARMDKLYTAFEAMTRACGDYP